MSADLSCAYCGEPAEGNYSIHRDGFGQGPEVPICDAHGGSEDPSCHLIWIEIAERMDGGAQIGVVCLRGLCDGSGLLAPHPATIGADAGIDDPCPCREVAPVSVRTAAWAEYDRLVKVSDAVDARTSPDNESDIRERAAAVDAFDKQGDVAEALGPRPAKVTT